MYQTNTITIPDLKFKPACPINYTLRQKILFKSLDKVTFNAVENL